MDPSLLLQNMREKQPLIHCITNYVAMNITANVVLAAGASPAMVHAPEEISDFTPVSAALSVNIGTLSGPWLKSMIDAAAVANENNIPWVLDPVAHYISEFRSRAIEELLALRPAVVRGNATEILTLAGKSGRGKGVDARDEVGTAHSAARELALAAKTVVAVTGAEDFVTDGIKDAHVSGGSSIMPQVTALGCSVSTLVAAYASVGPSFEAAIGALAHFKVAGTRAAETAAGPGSFQVHFLDALSKIRPLEIPEVLS